MADEEKRLKKQERQSARERILKESLKMKRVKKVQLENLTVQYTKKYKSRYPA
jgi:uncharacterized protein YlaN (UPF0358 family)